MKARSVCSRPSTMCCKTVMRTRQRRTDNELDTLMFWKVMTPRGIRYVELIRPGLGWRVRDSGEQWEKIKGDTLEVEMVTFKPSDVICEMELEDGKLKEV